MALKHCFSGTNGVPSQRIGKAAPQPAAGKVASALSGSPGNCYGPQAEALAGAPAWVASVALESAPASAWSVAS